MYTKVDILILFLLPALPGELDVDLVGKAKVAGLGELLGVVVVHHVLVHVAGVVLLAAGDVGVVDGAPHGGEHHLYHVVLKLLALGVEVARAVYGDFLAVRARGSGGHALGGGCLVRVGRVVVVEALRVVAGQAVVARDLAGSHGLYRLMRAASRALLCLHVL